MTYYGSPHTKVMLGTLVTSLRVPDTCAHEPFEELMGWDAANLNRHSGFNLSWS